MKTSLIPFTALLVTASAAATYGPSASAADPGSEDPGEDAGGGSPIPLTYREVMEKMKSPALRTDIETCVEGWAHPDTIALSFTVGPEGAVEPGSIEPPPPEKVRLCIAGAVSMLKFRASGGITPVKFTYSLPPPPERKPDSDAGIEKTGEQKVFEPDASVEKIPRYPGGRRAGIGFYGTFVAVNRGTASRPDGKDVKWFGKVTGGAGAFGEFLLKPFFAVGMEISIFFPIVERIKPEGESKRGCAECEVDILYQILARAKFPFRITKNTSIYPMVLAGYSGYVHRLEGSPTDTYHGLGAGAGAGMEDYTAFATLFFDIRYFLHAGWLDPAAGGDMLLDHVFTLNLGVRLP